MQRLMYLLPLLAFAGLLAYLAIGLGRDPSNIPSVLIDKSVPQFELMAIEGYEEGLAATDLKG